MKTLFKSIFIFAAAAAALVSCSKETAPSQTSDAKTIKFTVSTDDTKTSFTDLTAGKYPTIWNEGDKVKVIANYSKNADGTVTPLEGGKKASFTADLAKPSSTPYVISVLSPSSAYIAANSDKSSVTIQFPALQEPSATSVDSSAQLLGGTKDCGSDWPEEIAMSIKHIAAYALVSFSNLNLGGAAIQSVNISSDAKISGRYYWKPADNSLEVNSGSSTVSVTTTSSTNIWVAVAPVAVTSLKFVINTDKGTFTKEVSVSKTFTSGHVAKINVDMAGIPLVSSVKYVKVTSATDLAAKVGYEFIIAADSTDRAISTTQNTNNRASSAITREGNYIIDPADNVERFILEEGSSEGSYSFYAQGAASGYLYAVNKTTASGNYMKTQATKNDAASWNISFTDGIATVICVDSNLKGRMQYNGYNTSSLFSCYADTGTGREDIILYTLEGGSPVVKKSFGVDKTAISATADETSASFNVTGNVAWTISCPTDVTASPASGTGAASVTLSFPKNTESTQKKYEISVSTEDSQIATKELKVTLTQSAPGGSGISSILAIISEASSATAFEAELTDAVVSYVNGNNFYLEDATAAVYCFKITDHGLKEGDKISGTVSGKGYAFKNLPEITEFNYSSATKTSGATVPETTITISDLLSNYSSNMSRRIKIVGAKMEDGLGTSDRNGSISQNGSQIALYAQVADKITVSTGVTVDVIAFPSVYSTTNQLNVWSQDHFTISPTGPNVISGFPETKTVSVGSPWTIGATCLSGDVTYNITDGGTHATLSNGILTPVSAGTVTLTATSPASGDYTSQTLTCTVTVSDACTYKHVFSTKPGTGEKVALSGVNWDITATSLNAYNSSYAGVQFGTSKLEGDITLTSSSAWNYETNDKVKEIRIWLNTGGGTITPTVSIGGTSVASDGTVVTKKASLDGDYTKATLVTFKPTSALSGVVVIKVEKTPASGGAGYICAIEVDSE